MTRLPAGMFRHYVQHLDRKGVVPFGVPIWAAAICAIALQMYHAIGLNALMVAPLSAPCRSCAHPPNL